MPGYNHYRSCGCGWCDKAALPAATRSAILVQFALTDSKRILKEHHVTQFRATCFVTPNARCPVCAESVYYYQNSHGSRVFFNELGPTWDKHGCTSNSVRTASVLSTSDRPLPRKRGQKIEIIEAATALGWFRGTRLNAQNVPLHWHSAIVKAVQRVDETNFISATLLESAQEQTVYFKFRSQEAIILEGEVVSLNAIKVSILDIDALQSREFNLIWYLKSDFTGEIKISDTDLAISAENDQIFRSSGTDAVQGSGENRPRGRYRAENAPLKGDAKPKRGKAKKRKVKKAKEKPREPKPAPQKIRATKPLALQAKEKSENQIRREEMLSKVVIERRAIPHSRRQK